MKTSTFKKIVIVGCHMLKLCGITTFVSAVGAALAAMYKPIIEAIWTDETDDE